MDSVLSEVDDVVHTTSLGLRRSIITERRKQKILFFFKKKCCFLEGFRDKVETANGFGGRESKGQALVEGRRRLKTIKTGWLSGSELQPRTTLQSHLITGPRVNPFVSCPVQRFFFALALTRASNAALRMTVCAV